MVHCWEEYMWKVHRAVPMDPWEDNLQLLDVLIPERRSSAWLPTWLRRRERAHMARVGSIFRLGTDDSTQELDRGIRKNESTAGSLKTSDMKPNGGIRAAIYRPTVNTNIASDGTPAAAAAPPPVSNGDSTDVDGAPLNSFAVKSSSMPDIQASIRTSTSLLASFTGRSSASAQFDAKGSKTVTCNVNGVKSQRVDVDALLGMVTPRTSSTLPALWQPDIFLPQLRWCLKRGQTLWVVVEIIYANKIRIEADNQGQAKAEVKATKNAEVNVSAQVGTQKEGLWTVMASTDNPMFPLAFRLQKLDFDASGKLISNGHKKPLQRNGSLNTTLTKPLSSKHIAHTLSRSMTLSPVLS